MNVFTCLIISVGLFWNSGCHGQELSELQVSIENLEKNLYDYFGHPRNHLYPDYKANKDRVQQFMAGFLTGIRREPNVTLDIVTFNSTTERDYNGDVVVGVNYYLLFKGSKFGTREDKVIAVTSQYDTHRNASGVDNNGSGMVAFLEIARLLGLATCPRDYSIILVGNDLEEHGGSEGIKQFIYNYLVPVILKNQHSPDSPEFQGAICFDNIMNWNDTEGSQILPLPEEELEPIFPDLIEWWRNNGKRGDFMLSVSRDLTDEPITNNLHSRWEGLPLPNKYKNLRIGMPCEGVIIPGDFQYRLCRVLLRADYKEFYFYNTTKPLKALMVTDSAQYRGVNQQCYNQPCDDLSQVTPEKLVHLSKIAKATLDTLLTMSNYRCPEPTQPTQGPPPTGSTQRPPPVCVGAGFGLQSWNVLFVTLYVIILAGINY